MVRAPDSKVCQIWIAVNYPHEFLDGAFSCQTPNDDACKRCWWHAEKVDVFAYALATLNKRPYDSPFSFTSPLSALAVEDFVRV
jgi:hypothetical protein